MDSFGKEVPSFNLRGQEKVNTIVGGFVSILILIIIFLYANLKLTQLITGANPVISQQIVEDYYGPKDEFNLNENNIRFAFTVEGENTLDLKNDPRYVKFMAIKQLKYNNTNSEEIISIHECTQKDFKEFYPISTSSSRIFNRINAEKDHTWFCLDWDKNQLNL